MHCAQDYPDGAEAHGKTLAVGVFRWARFHAKLIGVTVQRFASAHERDAAFADFVTDDKVLHHRSDVEITISVQ